MANGDAAGAKGWDVVPNTDDVKVGYDEINYSRDLVAAEQDARVAADALKLNASRIIISSTTPAVVNGALLFKYTA
ncbi:hypothetical protein NYA9BBAC_00905 [Salinibacterium sp. NYA9b]